MSNIIEKVIKRPTEALTGPALAYFVFEFLTEHGVSDPAAAVIAVVALVLPASISQAVDRLGL